MRRLLALLLCVGGCGAQAVEQGVKVISPQRLPLELSLIHI